MAYNETPTKGTIMIAINRIKKAVSNNKTVLIIAANVVVPMVTILVVDAAVKKLESNEN